MSPREAAEIADEHIAFWRNRGVDPREAWKILGHSCPLEWFEVRGYMIRWLLSREAERPVVKRSA